jgi:hypothetical protein
VKELAILIMMLGIVPKGFGGACKKDPRVTGACFAVHGRLSFYNGGPSTRLWVIGTHHMLGVPTEESEMPGYLSKLMVSFDDTVYGDFVVCPYRKYEEGHMQFVCIESGQHLFRERRGAGGF